jgi:hypothetical protein
MLNFSMYQSGIEFKCPYSNRPLKPLTPLIGSTKHLLSGTFGSQNPLICLMGTCVLLLTFVHCLPRERARRKKRAPQKSVQDTSPLNCTALSLKTTRFATSPPTDNCPQPKEAQPLSQLDIRSI